MANNLNIHPVVSVVYLKLAQEPKARPGPVHVEETGSTQWREDTGHWEIEKIIDTRRIKRGKRKTTEYLVVWKGYPSNYNLWLEESAIAADDKIEEFHRNQIDVKALKKNPRQDAGGPAESSSDEGEDPKEPASKGGKNDGPEAQTPKRRTCRQESSNHRPVRT
ncbi:hypothetical protein BGZ61DRAFT_447275 [Ilyonectria robusta]|uniref:uncharacterized protein n=1 Tax=Ilyonectria robusta TaxID=1079257 RepID=UPI001E8E410D|nr:uncharacterized protein BGZ61DRAFT_447275 [Ilyonectria robusta]KAH8721597.1 hypothetical protein BGZ61DRAFT_447275 [Ilyonectria robusta]